jgi:hypothetical protein
MSGFSPKADTIVLGIANGQPGAIKKYAIDCNHAVSARNLEINALKGKANHLLPRIVFKSYITKCRCRSPRRSS